MSDPCGCGGVPGGDCPRSRYAAVWMAIYKWARVDTKPAEGIALVESALRDLEMRAVQEFQNARNKEIDARIVNLIISEPKPW